jgi:hypothetical protein
MLSDSLEAACVAERALEEEFEYSSDNWSFGTPHTPGTDRLYTTGLCTTATSLVTVETILPLYVMHTGNSRTMPSDRLGFKALNHLHRGPRYPYVRASSHQHTCHTHSSTFRPTSHRTRLYDPFHSQGLCLRPSICLGYSREVGAETC